MNNYRNDREQELVVVFTDLPWGMVTLHNLKVQSTLFWHKQQTSIVFIHVSDWQNAPKSSLVLAHAEFWYILIRWKNLSLDCVKSSEKVKRHLIDWCIAAFYIPNCFMIQIILKTKQIWNYLHATPFYFL